MVKATRWMAGGGALAVVALALAGIVGAAGRATADDKDTSGRLITWSVTRDGKQVLGTESLRVVHAESGAFFASGELKLKSGKKVHRKSHMQRDGEGRLLKYQRVEAGLKGAGYRMFEWQGQMRVAPINASGKPVDVGALPSARIRDEGLWHLYQTWGLPKRCEEVKLAFFDLGARTPGEATLSCVGQRKVFDAEQAAVTVNRFAVRGVAGDAVELWVDEKGELIGAKGEARWMLRAKYALEGAGQLDEVEVPDEEDAQEDAIKDRGVGE